ncbi:hypothetical protein J4E80_000216 [Alternaria sp. BMP 0032]|nr:hypothetical protein J4E80_000216 [Alternaria sp. BMP 0032]
MALPTWLTWNLQMPRSKKISILCLFATGVVCILFACLRVTQVAINASKPEAAGQPLDPTWLAIWGMVECSIAVIIGCCPAFAVLLNAFRFNTSYDSRGYRRQTDGFVDRSRGSRLELRPSGNNRPSKPVFEQELAELHWAGAHSSQEELRAKHDGIRVSTTVTYEQGLINTFMKS